MSSFLKAAASCDSRLSSNVNHNADVFVADVLQSTQDVAPTKRVGELGRLTLYEALTVKRGVGRRELDRVQPSHHLVDVNKPYASRQVQHPTPPTFGLPPPPSNSTHHSPLTVNTDDEARRARRMRIDRMDRLHGAIRNQIMEECQGNKIVARAAPTLAEPQV